MLGCTMNSQHIFSRDGPFSLLGGPHLLQKVRESQYRIPVFKWHTTNWLLHWLLNKQLLWVWYTWYNIPCKSLFASFMQSHSSSFFWLSIIVHLIVLPIFGSKFMVMILYDDSHALSGVVWEIRIYNSWFRQSELN